LLSGDDLTFVARGATVLASRKDNDSPVFWRNRYGEGQVIVFAAPIEVGLTLAGRAFDEGAPPYWRIYSEIARARTTPRMLEIDSPRVALTEHVLADNRVIVVAINHSPESYTASARLRPAIRLGEVWRGNVRGTTESLNLDIPPFDAAVFSLVVQ